MNKKQEEKIIEYATLHSKDCCVHTGDCDFDVKRMECCENMRIISTLLKQERQEIIEILEGMTVASSAEFKAGYLLAKKSAIERIKSLK